MENFKVGIPLISGMILTLTSSEDNDIKKNFSYMVIGIMILLIVLTMITDKNLPFQQEITTAFLVLLGYWFGKKEAEHEAKQ